MKNVLGKKMLISNDVALAVKALLHGGVIVYPTEGVWGLGCHPFNQTAVEKILTIKGRQVSKGLILLISSPSMLDELVDNALMIYNMMRQKTRSMQLTGPVTWLLPPKQCIPSYLTGQHDRIAIRITQHKLAKKLIDSFGMPLVSTSANLSGEPAVVERKQLSPTITDQADMLLLGEVGDLKKPTPIYDLISGTRVRG